MPYLQKGTIENATDNFVGSVLLGEPLTLADGSPNPPYRIDEKSGRQFLKNLSVIVTLYVKNGVPENVALWEVRNAPHENANAF